MIFGFSLYAALLLAILVIYFGIEFEELSKWQSVLLPTLEMSVSFS